MVHAQANELDWRLHHGRLEISYRITDPSIQQRRQDAEFALGGLYAALRMMTGEKYSLLRVDFAHAQPEDSSLHREAFQCPVRFDQGANLLLWPGEMLDEPLLSADPRLFQALLPGLEEERRRRLADTDLTTRIGLVIKDRLADGNLGVEEVARHLCMSKRTLQRRLQELEMEFGELVEEIRQATAMDMVSHSPLSLTEIAQRLGYAEPSSFTRAFRRWSGLTPREFRRRLRK
ncbi:HTH-type transcriptional regulator VirS [compost metagenome]